MAYKKSYGRGSRSKRSGSSGVRSGRSYGGSSYGRSGKSVRGSRRERQQTVRIVIQQPGSGPIDPRSGAVLGHESFIGLKQVKPRPKTVF